MGNRQDYSQLCVSNGFYGFEFDCVRTIFSIASRVSLHSLVFLLCRHLDRSLDRITSEASCNQILCSKFTFHSNENIEIKKLLIYSTFVG